MVKKILKQYPDGVVDAVMDALVPLARPDYLLARGISTDQKGRGQRHPYSSPAQNQPAYNGGAAPQPAYAPPLAYAAPPAYTAPPAYAAPPVFQLIQVAPSAAAPSPPQAAGGGAARKPNIGMSQHDPSKSFAAAHYAKPCMYCSYPSHNGDNCWKTFPELRVVNQ